MKLSVLRIASIVLASSVCFLFQMHNADAQSSLVLEAEIPLGAVSGRLDHMAVDLARQRLFLAEHDNNSVSVIDLRQRRVIKRIDGIKDAQGVAYVPGSDTMFVASGGTGEVSAFVGEDLKPDGAIRLGGDADNLRVSPDGGKLYAGYGDGAIAIIDPTQRKKIGDIKLKAHPEGFQIDRAGAKIYVNVPEAGEVAILDLQTGRQTGSWPMKDVRANFPMALFANAGTVNIVARRPAKLLILDEKTGGAFEELDTCGDADDVFVDGSRRRYYISCGDGAVEVVVLSEEGIYMTQPKIRTRRGARTSLFVPDLDRLFLAVPAADGAPAAIWVYRP